MPAKTKSRGYTKPKPYQVVGAKQIHAWGGNAILGDDMGLGKDQPLDAKIATPSGWTTMGELAVGSIISGKDGKPTTVTGVFPQGVKDVYRVTMRGGASTECGIDHLWKVRDTEFSQNKGWSVKTTRQLLEHKGRQSFQIPMVSPIERPTRAYKIDPYFMGVILGDGSTTDGFVVVTTPDIDKEIIGIVRKRLTIMWSMNKHTSKGACPSYRLCYKEHRKNPIQEEIIRLGVNVESIYKHIPEEYLNGSVSQRFDLLRGLMDTDGCSVGNRITFHTMSEKLADGVVELVRSLGGLALKHAYDRTKDDKGIEFQVNVKVWECPFYLKRKAKNWKPAGNWKGNATIESIVYSRKTETQCISVAAEDSLYVTDDYVVTHNTFQVLLYLLKTKKRPAIVVCPASVKTVWKDEAFKHFGLAVEVLEGTKPPSTVSPLIPHPPIIVLNYHILKYWAAYLEKLKPSVIIFDEGHNLGNRDTGWTKAAIKLSRTIPHKIVTTGTPMTNTPKNLWPLLHIVRPDLFPSFPKFAWEYCAPHKAPWGWQFNGARNKKKLREILLADVMIRRRKKDVLKELPPKTEQVIPIVLPPKKRKLYEKAETDFIEWVRANYGEGKAKKAAKAEAVSKMSALRKLTAKLKFTQAADWVQGMLNSTDEKIILFCHHRAAVKALQKRFGDICVSIHGGTKPEDRPVAMRQFQNNPKIRVFIGTLAAREGITLHAASLVAFLELWVVPGWMNQATDRAHRIGQLKNVNVYYLIATGTVEEHHAALLQKKNRIQQQIIDGVDGSDEAYGLDLSTELIKQMANGV